MVKLKTIAIYPIANASVYRSVRLFSDGKFARRMRHIESNQMPAKMQKFA